MDLALARRVHRNLMDVCFAMADHPGGTAQRNNGELIVANRTAMAFLNCVMRDDDDGDAADLIARARSYFFGRKRGFVVFTWPADPDLTRAALAAGLTPVQERYPEMVCHTALEPLEGDVRPVASPEDAKRYWEVCDAAYPSLGFPEGLFAEAFDAAQLLEPNVWACVAELEGRAVACASVWLASGVGMLGWVAARPEVRGSGLAAACTVQATNRAFEMGADVVSLQASAMGEPIYRRLGYVELFPYCVFGAMP